MKEIMKAFLIQTIRGIDRAELKETETNSTMDLQTKEIKSMVGNFYGVNYILISKNKEHRDVIADLLNKFFEDKDGFLEIGGGTSIYSIGEKLEFKGGC